MDKDNFMKQYFSVVLDSGKLKFKDISIDYVYGEYKDADDYPSVNCYGFAFYTIIDDIPFCHTSATLDNVFKLKNYEDYLKYKTKMFLKTCKDSLTVPF